MMQMRVGRCTTTLPFIGPAAKRSAHRHRIVQFVGASFDPSFVAIASAFDDRVLVMPEADAGNRVVLGLVGPPLDVPLAALNRRAQELEARWKLKARGWVAGLRSENAFDARFCV